MLVGVISLNAATIKGVVLDAVSGEPLIGATVMVKDSVTGTATGLDGDFQLNVAEGESIVVSYISYLSQEFANLDGSSDLKVMLKADSKELAAVEVVVKANKETEANLQQERIASNVAIENIGIREMSLKGLTDAEAGVKKITGISIAEAGEVIVRGLGDRYSLTTLNGLPIASPNPDMKLIPLDIFPTSAIQNITVSKVFRVDNFADYSGALIDITTRNVVMNNFFIISLSVGGNTATTGGDFMVSDRGSLFSTPKLPSNIAGMTTGEYSTYATTSETNPFGTGFSIDQRTALPDFGAQLGFGRKLQFNNGDKLDILLSANVDNSRNTVNDGFIITLDKSGNTLSDYDYDLYTTTLETAGLASLGYTFGYDAKHSLNFTSFYSRNAEDNYRYREGNSYDEGYIYGSNSTMHIYSLFTNQLSGDHKFSDKWSMDWTGSISKTSSDEPDRRQMVFYKTSGGAYIPLEGNQNYTSRMFAELQEDEYVGDVAAKYSFSESGNIKFGGAYRSKEREYNSSLYTYEYRNSSTYMTYRPELDSPFNTDPYINQENVLNGNITPGSSILASGTYSATSDVAAAFVDVDYQFGDLLVNLGVRFEDSRQWVETFDDGAGFSSPTHSTLNSTDLFPAMNLKYDLTDESSLRLSASKSVTRPSFLEMSPFRYQEGFGTLAIKGNGDLENGYNYNFDLRYDFFAKSSSDMLSVGGYYKYLDNPIERTQQDAGGNTEYTFMNSDSGYAAGLEVEVRKRFLEKFRAGINASYILTQVVLEEGAGIYTNTERELQGASPYLVNADLSYSNLVKDDKQLTMTLLYSLQGPRIDAVGVQGCHDIIQKAVQELNFVCSYSLNTKMSLSLKLENMLNTATVFTQEDDYGRVNEVGRYQTGMDASIGFSYKF